MFITIEITQPEIDALNDIDWLLAEMEKESYFTVFQKDEKGKKIQETQLSSDVYTAKKRVRYGDVWNKIKEAITKANESGKDTKAQ